jgi:regulatory protein
VKQPPSLRARAVRLLARRDQSRQELGRKLEPHAAGREEIEALLDDLQAQGWLSEQRVAEQVVRAAAGRYGACRIVQQLRDRGVSPEVAAQAQARAQEAELESARLVWHKRFGKPPADLLEWARQVRFLEQRGFDSEVIRQLLGRDPEQ